MRIAKLFNTWPNPCRLAFRTGLIPVPLYEVEAGAGNITVVESEESSDTWLWISRVWAQRYGKSNLAIIKALGDSMVPVIEPDSQCC